ncbi:2-C-methyl-D-erythritol 2,4-cyclodiphosphate synthase [Humitalea rosea]|uniref:Bifunctional enzyme IspD/IspF n=1 Tax=Humitalea rosea TaxID=990373 RepID=A0A2W7JEZ4_9PROT|nr:bifunctional 2-C-methyl-D-erythritol 4-phosphate cytidylyltransferase/2-C-methyl-D-erythritol 2,4-cyclodiphosphate synthase [Humitalea rosea]PZW51057.1 2-C-methyl-D-erythritol 2,4-cyclodiphosphate synthase [Humitalea rosea]
MRIMALLLAAGGGTRFGAATPKQFLPLAGKAVLRHAAEALLREGLVEAIQPVCAPGAEAQVAALLAGLPVRPPVIGGASRQDSVAAGLAALAADPPDLVLVHDGARPLIPPGTIAALVAALAEHPGAIPALAVAETLKRGESGLIAATVPRDKLFRAQTPQAFRFAALRAAQGFASAAATDDASVLEAAGMAVALVPGHPDNIKITWPEDLARMERMMAPALLPYVGTGFDVHRLVPGRPLVLCGITVPHEKGLDGHSDADVGLHALCDAIYGALAEGDIGRWFPPSEAEWKDADSARFLTHAAGRIAARGGRLVNADVTLICERPKITPHAGAMRARLAALLGVDMAAISVKATTTERLGFTGRGEGIAAQAAVMLLLPEPPQAASNAAS